jgi:hypothetical protein
MLIGGLHGRTDSTEENDRAKALIVQYRERFDAELGATQCDPLYAKVKAPGGLTDCALVGERGALILLEVLDQEAE